MNTFMKPIRGRVWSERGPPQGPGVSTAATKGEIMLSDKRVDVLVAGNDMRGSASEEGNRRLNPI